MAWWSAGRPVFVDPRGGEHFDGGWKPPQVGPGGAEALVARRRRRGIEPDRRTAGAKWKRVEDIPDPVFFGALEALG